MATSPTFTRARSQEAKQLRMNEILEAARTLGIEHGVGSVSLTDIANAAGMHKSALLRYFETREQIFLILTASAWREWADELVDRLERSAITTLPAIADTLAESLGRRPFFCDLVAHAALSLERHVSLEAIRIFKFTALDATHAVATALQNRAALTRQQAVDVITTAINMAGALQQTATPSSEILSRYRSEPALRHMTSDITPRLSSILEGLLTGFVGKGDSATGQPLT